jgi:hypothetical protein
LKTLNDLKIGLLYFVVFFICSSGFAKSTICLPALDKLSASNQKSFLTSEERKKIEDIFAAENPEQNPAQEAFKVLLEARLRGLPPEAAEHVRKAVENKAWRWSPFGSSSSYYDPRNGKIITKGPIWLRDSLVEYQDLIHETEHVIQDYFYRKEGKLFDIIWERLIHTTKIRFLEEDGAMRMEWEYFNAIPESVRKKFAEEVKQSSLSRPAKQRILRTLEAASHDVESYLKNERDNGRYSERSIFWSESVPYKINIAFATAIAAGITVPVTVVAFCAVLSTAKDNDEPVKAIYEKLCKGGKKNPNPAAQ